jgi:glycine hydroxymethyltransferase
VTAAALAAGFTRAFQSELVLYAGTNLAWPATGSGCAEQVGMMPVIGAGMDKQQPNVGSLAAIEAHTATLLCDIFRGCFAEARLQSCTQANLAVFTALLERDATAVCLHSDDGGHPSQNADGMLGFLPAKLLAVPFDCARQCIDDAATARLVRHIEPKIVIVGPSVVVRPSEMECTVAATKATGAALVVDVSHVAGLIAGGSFPNPLDQGADLITASSYKTLGCPPAGFVVGRTKEFAERIRTAVSPRLASNYDAGRLLRFASALETSRDSFTAYARAILANTAALRASLLDHHVPLLTTADGVFGTHQVVIPVEGRQNAARAVSRLHGSGITTSECPIPGRPGSRGIRLGTQLVTRRGMGVEQMIRIARIIAAVLSETGATNFSKEVQRLTRDFQGSRFCGEYSRRAGADGIPDVS